MTHQSHCPKQVFYVFMFFVIGVVSQQKLYACHSLPLVNFSVTTSTTGVTINASQAVGTDNTNCFTPPNTPANNTPFYLEVELACNTTANFTGQWPTCGTGPGWGTYPFYHSLLNIPNYNLANLYRDQFSVSEPYTAIFIPFTDLCPGTTYFLRARERNCGNSSPIINALLTTPVSFTTPGTPPSYTLSINASATSVCPGQQVTLTGNLLASSTCAGSTSPTFSWSVTPAQTGLPTTGTSVTFTPTSSCTVTLSATGGPLRCYSAAPVSIPITLQSIPSLGSASLSPTAVCVGGCVNLSVSSYSGGTLQWQYSPNGVTGWTNTGPTNTNPYQYCAVNATAYFRATVTSPCTTLTSNVITITPVATPTITVTPTNTNICTGQSITLTASGANSYSWNGGTLSNATGTTQTVVPVITTTYVITGLPAVGNCPGTRSVTVTVRPRPQVIFNPINASICPGNSVPITCGSDTNTYSWSGSGLSFVSSPTNDSVLASPTTTTTYSVTATSPAGCTSTGSITVSVVAPPNVTASNDTISFCPNSSALLTVSGAANYSWRPLAGATLSTANTILFNPPTSQTYWITGVSGVGCKDSIAVYVDARGLPTVDAGLSDSICPGSSKQLQATGVTPANYVWTSNPMLSIAAVANPTVGPITTNTKFYVQGTDTYGCVGRDSVQLFIRPLPAVNGGSDTMLCVGSSIVIGPAAGAVSYSWQGPNVMSGGTSSSPTVAPLSTANYIVTGTDIHQCTNKDTVLVTVNALPLANAGANVSICTSSTQLTATGGIDYSWSPSTNLSSDTISNPIASVTTTTTYTVTVRDANGCVNTDAVTITVYPVLATTISSSTTICANSQTVLTATGSGGDGGPYNYSWSPSTGIIGSSTQSSITASPSVSTIYTVTVTDQCGSVPVTATVQVTVNPLPVISFSSNITSGCTPICVNFTGNSTPAAVSCSYDFGDGNTASGCNPSHCYTTAGNYSVIYTVTDGNGCQNTVTNANMIQAYPVPQAGLTVTPPVTSILLPIVNISSSTCVGCDTIRYVFGGLPGDSTVNNPASAFDFIYSQPGTYSVTQYVTNQYGCEDSTHETIIVEPDFTFYAPNAFTPDNDGINDIFLVRGDGLDESSFELQIFNRWGKAVYGNSDMNKGWDGQVNGTVAANEVYIWRVTIRDNRGKPHDFVGHVTLIR